MNDPIPAKIKKLLGMISQLPYRQKDPLEVFLKEMKDTVKEAFGEKSEYGSEIQTIRFTPKSFFSSSHDYEESWNQGMQNAIHLLNKMLQDKKIPEGSPAILDKPITSPLNLPQVGSNIPASSDRESDKIPAPADQSELPPGVNKSLSEAGPPSPPQPEAQVNPPDNPQDFSSSR